MPHLRKPEWLKTRLSVSENYHRTQKIVNLYGLNTICWSGHCPNQQECWSRGTATFMIGGNICTRSCKFCNTKTGQPLPLNEDEPTSIAKSIQAMQLKHAVITSVDRDDLPDYGAEHWRETIYKIKEVNPDITLEALIPDFRGREEFIDMVCRTEPTIISHNMETVERLTPTIRSTAKYSTSLKVLKHIAENGIRSKSGIMLGLGERINEVEELMVDLRSVGCDILTLGQYLQPSAVQITVSEYIHPNIFTHLKQSAIDKGFKHVESGPLVRSSYRAENCI